MTTATAELRKRGGQVTPQQGELAEPMPPQTGVRKRKDKPEDLRGFALQTAASKRLEGIVGEAPQKIVAPANQEMLAKLGRAYDEFEASNSTLRETVANVWKKTGLCINEATIQAFIDRTLPKHAGERQFADKAGTFLTALIQQAAEPELTLNIERLQPLNRLCMELDKEIKVTLIGDTGELTGGHAIKGMIHVKGNAGDSTGYSLYGATINVDGDAGNNTGQYAENGTINVKGNAGEWTGRGLHGAIISIGGNTGANTGEYAESGTIHVKGNAGSDTGRDLNGATIIVDGDAGKYTGIEATKGTIHVGGKVKSLSEFIDDKVTITEGPGKRQVWPRTR